MTHPIVDVDLSEFPPKNLMLKKHGDFLVEFSKTEDCTLDYMRLSGVYWTLTALDMMNELHRIDKEQVINLILECQRPDGGLGPAPRHDSHMLSTLSGIQVLAMFDSVNRLNVDAVVQYILNLQQPDGSFFGDKWGEIDTRFSFCAIASLLLLGELDSSCSSGRLNKENCASYLERCQNWDGGFGRRPGSESHAGQAYCVIGSLAMLRELHRLDLERASWWLCERQLPSGGLNGRPEKQPDVCYSWWALASLTILGHISWINAHSLTEFILASQDDVSGGIADRPGDMADPFHTLFGLAGLSLLAQESRTESKPTNGDAQAIVDPEDPATETLEMVKVQLKPINPVLCMPQYIIDRMDLNLQMLT